MRMPPESIFQNDDGISIRSVDALRSTVKSTIDTASERVTRCGYHDFFSVTDPARMTGSTGRTQGARMVRTHAMNELIARVSIREKICNKNFIRERGDSLSWEIFKKDYFAIVSAIIILSFIIPMRYVRMARF